MTHATPIFALIICALLTLGCPSSSGDENDGGMGGEAGSGAMGGNGGTAGGGAMGGGGGEAGSGAMGGGGGTAGGGGSAGETCGADTACTPDAPSECGTLCQDICGGFENFLDAGCGEDNRCFCVCAPTAGVCTE